MAQRLKQDPGRMSQAPRGLFDEAKEERTPSDRPSAPAGVFSAAEVPALPKAPRVPSGGLTAEPSPALKKATLVGGFQSAPPPEIEVPEVPADTPTTGWVEPGADAQPLLLKSRRIRKAARSEAGAAGAEPAAGVNASRTQPAGDPEPEVDVAEVKKEEPSVVISDEAYLPEPERPSRPSYDEIRDSDILFEGRSSKEPEEPARPRSEPPPPPAAAKQRQEAATKPPAVLKLKSHEGAAGKGGKVTGGKAMAAAPASVPENEKASTGKASTAAARERLVVESQRQAASIMTAPAEPGDDDDEPPARISLVDFDEVAAVPASPTSRLPPPDVSPTAPSRTARTQREPSRGLGKLALVGVIAIGAIVLYVTTQGNRDQQLTPEQPDRSGAATGAATVDDESQVDGVVGQPVQDHLATDDPDHEGDGRPPDEGDVAATEGAPQAVADRPAVERPTADRPVAERPVAGRPVAERPVAEAPGERPPGDQTATAQPPAQETPAADLPEQPSREQVQAALGSVAGVVRACGDGVQHGTANVLVRVAPSGRVTTATVQGFFAGTETGSCIARAVRTARLPPFSGEMLSINFPYQL